MGDPRKECRLWQKNLAVLQMKTASLQGVGGWKGVDLGKLWKFIEYVRLRAKELTAHKHWILVDKVISYGNMG